MKIVIAPDSYKESLSALNVARQIELGFRDIFPDAKYILMPVADGGEGTVDAMVAATKGRKIAVQVTNALGEQQDSFFGLLGNDKCAVIEMAAASGLESVPLNKRNPLITTSYGTGELIRYALDRQVSHCIIGLGGSATNDGGVGMLQALGVHFLDSAGNEIGFGGGALAYLDRIDITHLDPRIKACQFEVACDVTNPLIGERGASAIFGPQKGATSEMVELLDANLSHYAKIIERDLGIDVSLVAGGGAAGGMGAALLAFLGAQLKPGIEIVTQSIGLEEIIKNADLVITGEGRIDSQTIHGKVPAGVARIAQRYNKPVIAIAGSLSNDFEINYQHGLDAVFSVLYKICSLEDALSQADNNVRITARNIAATLLLGRRLDC